MPDALGQIMQGPIPGILVALAMFLISVAVTTPIAWLMYKYVERPGIALGRRLVGGSVQGLAAFTVHDCRSREPARMTGMN